MDPVTAIAAAIGQLAGLGNTIVGTSRVDRPTRDTNFFGTPVNPQANNLLFFGLVIVAIILIVAIAKKK